VRLSLLDWCLVFGAMATSVLIGAWAGRRSGSSSDEFFLSSRSMPWWLLGTSMVATTFSTDTPNLVTGLTRTHGVAGNWVWWAFLLTSMTTAFLFAHLWRRSGVATDMAFYELRYSGRPAAFLRAFRGVYVGLLVNLLIMGAVTLAAVKFGSVLFGFRPILTVSIAGTATVIFAAAGGLRGVIISDCFLFLLAMTGSIVTAVVAVNQPAVGGLHALFQNPALQGRTDFIPSFSDPTAFVTLLVLPLVVQWWSVWYPGAEPGGGGFVAQRMLAARDEKHSTGALVLFNVAHYALRPWPWILVALSSLILFPDLESLRRAFPNVDPGVVNQDLAYAAMLTLLPHGWLGLAVASLVAAYLSTISSLLNLGSSYGVNDLYQRFLRPQAGEREKVLVGRLITIGLMIMTGAVALSLKSAMQAFNIMLSIGAGTGLIFIVRWYWPRVSAWSEISAMVFAFASSMAMQSAAAASLPDWLKLVGAVGITTAGWVVVTLLTPPTRRDVLESFYRRVHPPGALWRPIATDLGFAQSHATETARTSSAFGCVVTGCAAVYGLLFSMGALLRGATGFAFGLMSFAVITAGIAVWYWRRASGPTTFADPPAGDAGEDRRSPRPGAQLNEPSIIPSVAAVASFRSTSGGGH
jgi:solute:Na+ symporter, SSS family